MRPSLTVALLLACALPACHGGPDVARVSNGRDVSGRYVSEEAYAAFLRGAAAEAAGDAQTAAVSYRLAIAEDANAAEAWARLGVVLCRSAASGADRALARARELGADRAAPFVATAECLLARGDAAHAVEAAEDALRREPDAPECTWTLADALSAAHREGEARALVVAHALRAGDDARRFLDERRARGPVVALPLEDRLPSALHVALDALATGRPEAAAQAAQRGLVSDPGDTSLRAVALSSADLAGDETLLARLATPLPAERTALDPAAALEFEALLARRIGAAAARAFHDACATIP